MNLARLAVDKRVLTTMIVMVFVVLGLYAYTMLATDLFPKIDFPFVIVSIVYPGAGPEELESEVAEIVEDEIVSISGLKSIQTTCSEGVAVIGCEFELEVDPDVAATDVRDKIAAVRGELPEDVQEPVILKFDINAQPILELGVMSDRPVYETYQLAEHVVKPELTRVPGVATINIAGGLERQVHVDLARSGLARHKLSIMQVVQVLAYENMSVPAGRIETADREFAVRAKGKFQSVDEIAGLRFGVGEGDVATLRDIAAVESGYEDERQISRVQGQRAVTISMVAQSGANKVAVAADLLAAVAKLNARLPSGTSLIVVNDDSEFIRDSVSDVFSNILIGILLTAVLLYAFVQDLRLTVVAAITMPATVIATFLPILLVGYTLNMMTLLALSVSVGVLVTNAILILENISRFRDMGRSPADAASQGTSQIAMAIAASVLTNVVVFTPVAFMSGIVGRFFAAFGITTVFATAFSLLMAFTLTPMLAAYALERPKREPHKFIRLWHDVANRHLTAATGKYVAILRAVLRRPGLVVAAAFATLVLSFFLMPFIGMEFLDAGDPGIFYVSLEMPTGSTLEETDAAMRKAEGFIRAVPELDIMSVSTGRSAGGHAMFQSSQGNLASALVKLVPRGERDRTTDDVLAELRGEFATIPGAYITARVPSMGAGEYDVEIEVAGRDQDTLVALAEQVRRIVRENPNAADADVDWRPGKPEVTFVPDRRRMAEFGLSLGQVAMAMRAAIQGDVATKYRAGGEELDVVVRMAEEDRDTPESVGRIMLPRPTEESDLVALSDLGTLKVTSGPVQITRKDRQRMVTVTASVVSSTTGVVQGQIEKRIAGEVVVPQGYSVKFGGNAEMMAETFTELFKAMALAVVLTYMLLAAMLNSYRDPFVIMLTIPLGLIGVLLILFLTGVSFSMFSLMAMVMLIGILVNNAILILDEARQRMQAGGKTVESLIEACGVKFRAILMANLATIIAVMPLALGVGSTGAELRRPIAIVTIGGLMASATLTLFVIPAMYALFNRKRIKREAAV